MAAEANGKAFLGIVQHVKKIAGKEVLSDIIDTAGPGVKEVFSERILAVSWYPYSAFAAFLDAVHNKMNNGDRRYCFKVGELTGQKDMETVFSIYKKISSPAQLIRACSNVWEAYYRNAGKMEALRWEPDDTVVRIDDFKEMSKNHCILMQGWMHRTLQLVGLEVLHCVETRCMRRGDEYHEFYYRWKPID